MYGSNDLKGIWMFVVFMMSIGAITLLGFVGWGIWSLIKFIF